MKYMSDFDSLGKTYLRPDYSEEDLKEDPPGPSEDDDDDDDEDDDDLDEDISDTNEGEEEEQIEKITRNQEKLVEKIMTETPFGQQSTGTSPSWRPENNSPWPQQQSNRGGWNGNTNGPWGGSTNQPWTGGGSTGTWGSSAAGKKEINREKDIIFCDVFDCLVETLSSNGRPGFFPRGVYDIRLRFEVWDKIACFNPRKIFGLVCGNVDLFNKQGYNSSWIILMDYIARALSEYLRIPNENCQIIIQNNYYMRKEGIISSVIEREKIDKKESIIQIGLESGLYGQSNRDFLASQAVGIDYLDLGQLLNLYY